MPEPTSIVVFAAPVIVVNDESPVIAVLLNVSAAMATEAPVANATNPSDDRNAIAFLGRF